MEEGPVAWEKRQLMWGALGEGAVAAVTDKRKFLSATEAAVAAHPDNSAT